MYYLGVDAGGTKTTAVLADVNGEVVRMQQAGPGNVAVLREEHTETLIKELVSELLQGEPVDRLTGITLGFAGVKEQAERDILKRILTRLGISGFSVLTDAELLYFATLGEDPGILIAAGTGSVCVGKDKDAEVMELGGWGYLLGDDGSGFHLGRLAMRVALHEADRGAPLSELSQAVLDFFDVRHPRELVSKVHASANPQFLMASCARIVGEHASKGEPNAIAYVDTVADALCSLAQTALARFEITPPIATGLAGSLLSEGSAVLKRFKAFVERKGLPLEYRRTEFHPAAAAVLHALRQAGVEAKESLLRKLKEVDFD